MVQIISMSYVFLLHMGVTTTAEATLVSLIDSPTQTHPEGGNYYADKSLFSNCFSITIIVTLNTHTGNEVWTSCVWYH